jgi:hypothetical protein
MIHLLLALALQAPSHPPFAPGENGMHVQSPSDWVAFSADMRIVIPGQPERWGRHVQDEHGCRRPAARRARQ